MSAFDRYAAIYDLVYADKNYDAEAAGVAAFIRDRHPAARTLLDLGCGTGRHGIGLARLGFAVTGLDRSRAMLARAGARLARLRDASIDCRFVEGDARDFLLPQRYDAVTALFHVFSYFADEAALRSALRCAAAHLQPRGILIFDCWHGPAVAAQGPDARTRRFTSPGRVITRRATPRHDPRRHLVDVCLRLTVRARRGGPARAFNETHRLRYWFPDEIERLLGEAGLALEACTAWPGGAAPEAPSWSVCYIAQRVPSAG